MKNKKQKQTELTWVNFEHGRIYHRGESETISAAYDLKDDKPYGRFYLRIGANVFEKCNLELGQRYLLLYAKENITDYLLVKSLNGYKLVKNGKGYRLHFLCRRPGMKGFRSRLCSYEIQKDKIKISVLEQ